MTTNETSQRNDRMSRMSEQRPLDANGQLDETLPVDNLAGWAAPAGSQSMIDALYGDLLPSAKTPTAQPASIQGGLQGPSQVPLSALSAEIYNDGSAVENVRRPVARQNGKRVWGFVMPPESDWGTGQDDAAASDALPPLSPPPLQRPEDGDRPTHTSVEEKPPLKKARGRPRVEAHSETALDRRRTQIRLAQRAYRYRKESTITTLRERIRGLENTIDEMHKAFVQLNDDAVSSGIIETYPRWGQGLKRTTELLISLATGSHEESTDAGGAVDAAVEGHAVEGHAVDCEVEQHNQADSYAESPLSRKHKRIDSMKPSFKSTEAHSTSESAQTHPRAGPSSVPNRSDSQQDAVALERILTARPFTFSHQEATFARRLQRRAWEQGYQLLLNAGVPDGDKARIFFMFQFSPRTKDQLISDLRKLLKRTTEENIDCISGLTGEMGAAINRRYVKRNDSKLVRGADSWWLHSTGRQAIASGDHSSSGESAATAVDIGPYEGEWFDPADVEKYLRHKGVHFSGHASYAEVELTDESYLGVHDAPTGSSSDNVMRCADEIPTTVSNSLPIFPTNNPVVPQVSGFAAQATPSWPGYPPGQKAPTDVLDAPTSLDAFFGFERRYLGGLSPAGYDVQPLVPLHQKTIRTMTLDVSRLLDEISKTGVCLGGSPGFRRSDVDSAMRVALQVS